MRKTSLAAAAVGATIGLAPVSAFAAWTIAGAGSGSATATTVNRATAPTATRGSGTVALSWSPTTLANAAAVAGYDVIRHVGSTTTTVCSYVTTRSCVDNAPVAGPASYGVVARIGTNWQGPESPTTDFTYDNLPPTTTMTTVPTAPNAAGWFNQNVTVTLSATDPGYPAAGVREIDYTIGAGRKQVVPGNTATFTVSAEGTTQITYAAIDNLTNTETTHTATIRVDKTPPSSSINPPDGSTPPASATITANDGAGSGVASITYAIDGGTATTVTGATATVSLGSAPHTVTWYATDVAGNVSSPSQKATYSAPALATPVASCTASSGGDTVSWNAVSGATSYTVTWWSTSNDQQSRTVSTLSTAVSPVFGPNGGHPITVTAINSTAKSSPATLASCS